VLRATLSRALPFVRAIGERAVGLAACALVYPKGAVGLMQLMPTTAKRLGVQGPLQLDQNVSVACVLAWLMQLFFQDDF